MIKGIIFDCFGVLTTDGWLPFKAKYFKENQSLWDQATALNRQVDSGAITYKTFVESIAEMAGTSVSEAHKAVENNVCNQPLFEYITAQLKPHYKIGLLSNAGDNWLDKLFGEQNLKLFDATVLSGDIGIIKPDPRAYEITAERLGLKPEECVLIDDQERYCTGAKDVGMAAIWYKDFEQMKSELKMLLANTKN